MSFVPKRRRPFHGQLSKEQKDWLYQLNTDYLAGERLTPEQLKILDELAEKRFAELALRYKHNTYTLPRQDMDEFEYWRREFPLSRGRQPFELPVPPWQRPVGPSFEELQEQEEAKRQRQEEEQRQAARSRQAAQATASMEAFMKQMGLRR